jgi:tripartite-type tricarboxylate transporter receptor subunit TctC
MARLVFGVNEITRPLTAPPGVPPERLAALRKAFVDVTRDPGLIEDGKKLGFQLDPMPADELMAEFNALYRTPKEIVQKSSVATSTP